jgi:hypothetical protein
MTEVQEIWAQEFCLLHASRPIPNIFTVTIPQMEFRVEFNDRQHFG